MYLQQGLRRSSTRQIGSMSEATRGILQKSATRKCLGGAHSRTHIPPLAAHNHGQGHHTHASRNRFLSPPGLLSLGSGGRGEDGLTTANVLSPRLLAGLRGGMSMVVDRPCLRTSTRVPAGRRTSWRLEGRPASSAAFLRRNRPSRRLIASLAVNLSSGNGSRRPVSSSSSCRPTATRSLKSMRSLDCGKELGGRPLRRYSSVPVHGQGHRSGCGKLGVRG